MKNYLKIKNIFFPLDKNFIKDKKLKIYKKTLSRIDVFDNNKKPLIFWSGNYQI